MSRFLLELFILINVNLKILLIKGYYGQKHELAKSEPAV